MTVGIFRSRIFAAGRAFLRDGRGVSAVETAFAFPVILAAFFIIVEFANMALTIQVGESAVSSALLRFRDAGELGASAENDIRQGIAAYSFGYLKPSNVSRVTVEAYESLDALGNPGGTNGAGEDDEEGTAEADSSYPAWKVVVVITKDFITPLPRLILTNRKDFTYRYERVIAYYPRIEESEGREMIKSSFFKKIAAAAAGLHRESGSIAVETALGITFLVSTAVILSDMHQIGIERERLEAGAGSIAVNAAQQPKLTQYGLNALVDASLETETRDTEVIIMNVLQSGAVQWMIRRGDGAMLCELNVEGKYFTGELPVDPPEISGEGNDESDVDGSTMSMIVVDVCRRTAGFELGKHLRLPRVIQVENIYRSNNREIKLDEALEEENLMPSDDDGEGSNA